MNSDQIRNVTNIRFNGPRLKRSTIILSNGATMDFWTSLPLAKLCRSEIDIFSFEPDFQFDDVKDIRAKRRKEKAEKLALKKQGRDY
eukprot:gene5739-7138_t